MMNGAIKSIIGKEKVTADMFSKFKVCDLKEVCVFFSLRSLGRKDEIIHRIVFFCNHKKIIKKLMLSRKKKEIDLKMQVVNGIIVSYENNPLSIENIHYCIENNLKYACPAFLSQTLNPLMEEQNKINRILNS